MPLVLSGCGGGPDCQALSLFRIWHKTAYVPKLAGSAALDPLDLTGFRYGPGQTFYIYSGSTVYCAFKLDIEKTSSDKSSEHGNAVLTNPQPANQFCTSNAMAISYSVSCTNAVAETVYGIATYAP